MKYGKYTKHYLIEIIEAIASSRDVFQEDPRYLRVIMGRIDNKSYVEIGKEMNYSSQRIRQLEAKALRMLKSHARLLSRRYSDNYKSD